MLEPLNTRFYDKNGNIIKSDKPSASFESHIDLENF